jgi:hypothetical protein
VTPRTRVKLDEHSRLPTVATAVGAALARHEIRAVLTGGACASVYTHGQYQSRDMDFIVVRTTTQARLDTALGSIGFVRKGDRYVHPRLAFYVEFPRGPLAIGDDYRIRPVLRRLGSRRLLMLSATDSCRDRLAAFYHWNDRQSLQVAVQVARAQRVNVAAIRRWSAAEGFPERFQQFLGEVRRTRVRRGPTARVSMTRSPRRRRFV